MIKLYLVLVLLVFSSCSKEIEQTFPEKAELILLTQLAKIDSITILNSGFGSGIVQDKMNPSLFYLITDRGLNFWRDDQVGRMIYSDSIYTPQIGRFRLENDNLRLDSIIKIHDDNGYISGRKRPFHTEDHLIVDAEGLAQMKDGSFWIADEEGPSILHVNPFGKLINNYSMKSGDLPLVLLNKSRNRGFEGITITPSEKYVLTIMQSALQNPDKSVLDSTRLTRIIRMNIQTKQIEEFAYLQEKANHSNSDITAITDSTFLVIERGSRKSKDILTFKKVYKITIRSHMNIHENLMKAAGKQFYFRSLEQVPLSKYKDFSITPVEKEELIDLNHENYMHEKPEGVTVINKNLIAVSNDNDFGLALDKKNNVIRKKLSNGHYDMPYVYFYKIKKALY